MFQPDYTDRAPRRNGHYRACSALVIGNAVAFAEPRTICRHTVHARQSLFRDLAVARADGSLRSLLARLSRIDVLVIHDWAMSSLSEPERRDFWKSAKTATRCARRS